MSFKLIDKVDVSYLDELLVHQGLVCPVHSEQLRELPVEHLQAWCVLRGVYQIPTWELIEWLKQTINGRSAIEICAGRSCLGRHVGIRMFDNYMQAWPTIRAHYERFGQEPALPSPDVERMDANDAVRRFRPQVVIGAWVTQRWVIGSTNGNIYGPDKHDILDAGCAYIHVGNASVHGCKRILIRSHRELSLPWLYGRGLAPALNRVWVWEPASSR